MTQSTIEAESADVATRPRRFERATLVVVIVVLIWLMDWLYVNVLVAIYGDRGYPGYPFVQHGTAFRFWCWGFGLIPLLWMPASVRRPSQVLTWCMYLMVVLPTAVIGVYSRQSPSEVTAMLASVAIGLAILCAPPLLPTLVIPRIRADRLLFWGIITVVSVAAYGAMVRNFGTTFQIVSLHDVYLQREAAQAVSAGALTRYLTTWQGLVINPLLMAVGIARRRPLVFMIGLAGQIVLFGIAASRLLLATPFIVLGFHLLLRRGGRRFGHRATVASASAFAFLILFLNLGGFLTSAAVLVFDALVNRLFMNSGFLTVLYFKFFHDHPHVGFAEVKPFNLLVQSPYGVHYPEALAWNVWGYANHPNANLFADGYAQLGLTGLVIEAVVMAIMLWLLDSVASQRKLSVGFVAMICAGQVSSVVNAATPTIMLGEGFTLLLVLLAILPAGESATERGAVVPAGSGHPSPIVAT